MVRDPSLVPKRDKLFTNARWSFRQGQKTISANNSLWLARHDAIASNALLETLAEWNTFLEHRKLHNLPVPPCP